MLLCLLPGILLSRRYPKAINIISVPVTFFSLQASHPDAWPGSPAPLNMNHYANKKSAAESMLDVALLMANASQLKAVLEQGPNLSFYTPIVTLISISLCLQVTVGVLLIFTGERVKQPEPFKRPASQPSRALCLTSPSTLSLSKISPMSSPLIPDKQPIASQTSGKHGNQA